MASRAPEGMHSDEVCGESNSPRFGLGPTPPVAAVFLLISLFPQFEASMGNAPTQHPARSTIKLREERRSFIENKSEPAGRIRLRLKQDRPRSRGLLSAFRPRRPRFCSAAAL
jgi:hypothetical protein